MTLTYSNVRPLVGGKLKDVCDIVVKDGKIISIGSVREGEVIDCGGKICAAGFIDIHTHGGWGHDCMEATEECLATISAYHLYTGITSYCPTTMTATPEDIEKAVDAIRSYKRKSPYARIVGAHLEGPYLSQKAAGAHPPKLLISPLDDDSFVEGNLDVVTRVTVAPNVRGADVFTAKYALDRRRDLRLRRRRREQRHPYVQLHVAPLAPRQPQKAPRFDRSRLD